MLQSQSSLLKEHLREIPPPGVDAEGWDESLRDVSLRKRAVDTVETIERKGLRGKARVVVVGAKSAASGIADGATSAASTIAGSTKGRIGRRK